MSDKWKPKVLVLGPGGIKGFLELGALLVFEKEGYLTNIQRYVGVSVGAIIGLLLIAGYTVTEIIAESVDTSVFQDITSIKPDEIKSNLGVISNRHIREMLVRLIKKKFTFVPTLQDLYMLTNLDFTAVTLNLDHDRVEYLSRETEPSLSCVDAVLMSMNIPLLFYKIKYQGSVYIDGAFGNPYPVDVYDDGNTDILGLYINMKFQPEPGSADFSIQIYLYKIALSAITQIRTKILESASPRCRHLRLSTSILDVTGLSVSIQQKSDMIMEGYKRALRFLRKLDGDLIVYDGDTDKVEVIEDSLPIVKGPKEKTD